tara:strand:+ start:1547 stop:1804 length:258 start_codon:yes stop_codon:yes gene_type:complete
MAGELSNRIIDTGARMAARQAYLLNVISERFSTEDTISKVARDSGAELDAFETYMLANPEYDLIRESIMPAISTSLQAMNQNEVQ